MGPKFKFEMKDRVRLVQSGEMGVVIGRAEYLDCVPHYYVRYVAGDGRQIENWQSESAVEAAE